MTIKRIDVSRRPQKQGRHWSMGSAGLLFLLTLSLLGLSFHRSGAVRGLRPDPTGERRPRRYRRGRGELRRCNRRPARPYQCFESGLRTHSNITVG